ncbi:MAG: thiamine-phosphate kinase [Candidatus Eremiobacteraeota bacterium]|nr:thiamine-phosphate kinase [Candidatus Eremiobacteraeota bacterium]
MLNEDDVVAAIREIVGPSAVGRVRLGIGDDAALWQPSRSHRAAITSDSLVEGVHFSRDTMTLEDAGWRAMMANASDLAAMGARPLLATVSLAFPVERNVEEIYELYRGLAAAARAAKLVIVGGDLSRAPVVAVSIAAVGEVRASNVKTRAGARPGDAIATTGPLGAARAGLRAATQPELLCERDLETALAAFRRPQARSDEGRFLAASRNVHAMMDCSDGLSTDLDRLCTASGVGAKIDRIPVAGAAKALAHRLGEDAEAFALAGGEDFELLVAIGSRAFRSIASRFSKRFHRPLEPIGTVRSQGGIEFRGALLARTGWDHFEVL